MKIWSLITISQKAGLQKGALAALWARQVASIHGSRIRCPQRSTIIANHSMVSSMPRKQNGTKWRARIRSKAKYTSMEEVLASKWSLTMYRRQNLPSSSGSDQTLCVLNNWIGLEKRTYLLWRAANSAPWQSTLISLVSLSVRLLVLISKWKLCTKVLTYSTLTHGNTSVACSRMQDLSRANTWQSTSTCKMRASLKTLLKPCYSHNLSRRVSQRKVRYFRPNGRYL